MAICTTPLTGGSSASHCFMAASKEDRSAMSALVEEHAGERTAQTTKTTNQEVGSIGVELQGLAGLVEHRSLGHSTHGQDQLSEVTTALHETEGILHRTKRDTLVDEVKHSGEDLTHLVGLLLHDKQQVEESEGGVLHEGLHVETGVASNITQTDLHEGSEGGKTVPRLPQQLTRQGVEDAVHTPAVSHTLDSVDERCITRVEDVLWVNAILLDKKLALLGRADSRVDRDAEVVSKLDGGLAHTTCCGVDEHSLTLAQLAQVHEGVVGRGVNDRHGGSLLEAHGVRNLTADNFVSAEKGCVGAYTASSDAVPDLDASNSWADSFDNTTDFQTQEGVVEDAHRGHNITEVDTGGLDLDLNLALAERLASPPVIGNELQGVQKTGLANSQTQRAIVLLERHDTRPVLEVVVDVSVLLVVHAETIFGVGAQDAASQRGTNLETGGSGQVEHVEPGANNLSTDNASQTIDHVEVGLVAVGKPEEALRLEDDFAECEEVSLGYFVQDHLLHLEERDGSLAFGRGDDVLGGPGDSFHSIFEGRKNLSKLAGESLGRLTSLRRLNNDDLGLGLDTVDLGLGWVLVEISHALASGRHDDKVRSGNVGRTRGLSLAKVEDIEDSLALGLGHGIADLAGDGGSIGHRGHGTLGDVGLGKELNDSSSRVGVEEHVSNLGRSLQGRNALGDLLNLFRSGELHAVVPADSRAQVARLGLLAGLNWLLGCGGQLGGAEVSDLQVHFLELLVHPVDLSSSVLETVALGRAVSLQGCADVGGDVSGNLKLSNNSGHGGLVDVELLVVGVGTTDPGLEDSIEHGWVDEERPVNQLVAVGWAAVLEDDIVSAHLLTRVHVVQSLEERAVEPRDLLRRLVELVTGKGIGAGLQDALVLGDLALMDVRNLRLHLLAGLGVLDGHQTASVVTECLITASARGDGPLPPGVRVGSGSGNDVGTDVGDNLGRGVIAHGHGTEEGHIAEFESADRLSRNLVLTDPGLILKREESPPHTLILVHHGHRSANERLAGLLAVVVVEVEAALRMERLGVVPRVRRKVSELLAFDILIDTHDLERGTLAEQVGSKVEGSVDTILATLEDRGVGNILAAACSVENLLNGATQSGVRAKLNQQIDGWVRDRVGQGVGRSNKLGKSFGEQDRADQVASPVGRAELLRVDLNASNRRDHLGSLLSRAAALNVRDGGQVVTHDLVHVLGVVSNLDLELTSEDLLLVEHWQKLVETSNITRDGDTLGRVDASNTDLASIDLGNPFLGFLAAQTDSHHASVKVAGLGLDQRRSLTTEVSGGNRIFVAQGTDSVGSTHLTGRVTNALGRGDAPSAELIDQCNLEDSADGLRDLRHAETRLFARAHQLLSRVPLATALLEVLRRLRNGLAKGLALEQLSTHTGPLGTLATQLGATLTEGVGQVGNVLGVGGSGTKAVEVVGKGLANTLQTSLVGSRESKETLLVHDGLLGGEDGAASSRAAGQERVTLALIDTLENNVCVGATHSEGGDRHTLHISDGPGSKLLRDVDVPLVEWDTLVQLVEVDLGRNHAVLHGQDTLDQTSNGGTSFQVTDVGLDGADNDLAGWGGLCTESVVDGPDFHRVTSLGTSTVALHELCALHVEAEILVDIADESGLGLRAGEGDTLGPAIRVDTGTPDDSSDWVTITLSVCQPLDQDDTATLTTTVSIAIVVEGSAVAVWRQETKVAELHGDLRVEDQVHTTGHSHIRLSVAHTLAGQSWKDRECRSSG
ncbi:hypothetical protein VSDG_09218 [Cytospora chrysosperma]|uniref:Uncharacterized protein n=1 Tax=Cytospora chrysosperma TaxID=252740 RepID=A0A423VC78_CYTCH|nr:hypothetical protein VSDG_09218 [Valsa sordida]